MIGLSSSEMPVVSKKKVIYGYDTVHKIALYKKFTRSGFDISQRFI